VHDPFIKEDEGLRIETDLEAVLKGCDAVVLMTAHDRYKAITTEQLISLLRHKIVIDGRNVFDFADLAEAGFILRGVGRGKINCNPGNLRKSSPVSVNY
jgi:UDP-N-acetyl-D-mannosaminuronate dehydrogenase